VRIIQISDTHLSRGKAHFTDNWAPLARWIEAERPDLVIHTGDVTVDGAAIDDDLAFAADLLEGLGVRSLALPGNHDVGETGPHHQPVSDERLARWRARFGADWWVDEVAGWRLIGLDAQLLGSGSAAEAAQMAWLEATMAKSAGRQIAWFLHKPLFIDSPAEGDTGYWSVKPLPRARLLTLVDRYRVALVASGHLHKARDFRLGPTRYLWAPASSFLVGAMQPALPGEKRLGAVFYEFAESGYSAGICEVPGLVEHWLDDVLDEVYPRRPDPAPAG
jgi:3',5'-cyclic AMP phosphodiesterase CpdA